jgi:hypothetical protein
MTTPGLAAYWRLGEPSGTAAADETAAHPGTYSAPGVTLGAPGALTDDPDTSAAFDGASGEMTATTPPLSSEGTLEGWFDWRGGIALMRDNTLSGGWILAYDTSGKLATRIAGTSFTTGRSVASVQDGWHHFVLVRRGAVVRLYLDGQALALTPTGSGEVGSTPSTGAWHIMRNGRYTAQFTSGRADEVAVYASALTAADVQRHFQAGRGS